MQDNEYEIFLRKLNIFSTENENIHPWTPACHHQHLFKKLIIQADLIISTLWCKD